MAVEGHFVDPIAENPESWREALPEDLRGEASLDAIKDFPGLIKNYVHAQKMVGADKVVVPGEAATEEEMNNFYTALGRPDNADGYGVKSPDEMPDGFPYSEDLAKAFAGEAHKLGLTPTQANGIFNWYNGNQIDAFNGINKDREEGKQNAELALRKEFGKAYDDKIANAKTLIRKFADDDIFKHLEESGFGNDPNVIKLIARIAQEFSEDRLKGEGTGVFGHMSPEEAQSEIQKLNAEKEFSDAYMNKKNAGHAGAVARMESLYKLAYPEDK